MIVLTFFSAIDLDSKTINGGQMADFTAGVNWYLNPVTRISANYVFADLFGVGRTNIYQIRFQLDF